MTLPSGTVTFVFTDIEGSTGLLKRLGDAEYANVLAVHRRLVRDISITGPVQSTSRADRSTPRNR